jgi:hypothetical protein
VRFASRALRGASEALMHAYTELMLRVVGEKFRARGMNALAWSELGPGALTRLGPGSLTTLGPGTLGA